MTAEQIFIFVLLGVVLGLLVWGRWRFDVVAFGALLAAVLAGVVPIDEAFRGFSHPAVIVVAVVLVLSRALAASGAVDLIAHAVDPGMGKSVPRHIGALGTVGALLSGFINNVAALALLMPVAIRAAVKVGISPGAVLMPLSFATILGGTITLIGTPPNIVIATYRGEAMGEPFGMFDFAPVGAGVTLVGMVFVILFGWRLIPKQRREKAATTELFAIDDYVTEAKVTEKSSAIGENLGDIETAAEKSDAEIIGLIRGERRLFAASRLWRIQAGDVLVVKAAPEAIDKLAGDLGLELVGRGEDVAKGLRAEDWTLMEAVVTQGSMMEGRTSERLRLRSRYGVMVLGVSRQGQNIRSRLRSFRFKSGDILLLQGTKDRLPGAVAELGCLPLAERGLQIGQRRWAWVSIAVFAGAIALAASGALPSTIALALAALAMLILGILPMDEAYKTVDWRVVILLGSMIPVGGAMETTGAAAWIADGILAIAGGVSPTVLLVLLFIVAMTLSDVVNNVATAVIMAPIAAGIADRLALSADPFLMAVAVASSCAFLTPIGHKNNMIILGPGGYHFGDFWRMGLPLEIAITAVAVPLILIVWPF